MATTAQQQATAQAPAQQAAPTYSFKSFNNLIADARTQKYLEDVLQDKKATFVNNLVALVSNSDNLQDCEPQSIMYAALKATALNLPLDDNLGFAYIIPYNDNKTHTKKAKFQCGYKGKLQLIVRSGKMARINKTDVREGELVNEDLLTGEIQLKRMPNRENLPIIGFAAYIRTTDGLEKSVYMSREEIEQHALRKSKQVKNGKLVNTWESDFNAMAEKTVLLKVMNFAPLSTELLEAINSGEDYESDDLQPANVISSAPTTIAIEEAAPAAIPAPAPKAAAPQPVAQSIETRQASF